MNEAHFQRRKRISRLMFALTSLCAAVSLSVLFVILGYIAYHGLSTLNLDFFTKLPKPVGETGGGSANSILGSAKLVGLAGLLGIPIGVLGGVYLAEYGAKNRLGFMIRYAADVLNGVPSIVIGISVLLLGYALLAEPPPKAKREDAGADRG